MAFVIHNTKKKRSSLDTMDRKSNKFPKMEPWQFKDRKSSITTGTKPDRKKSQPWQHKADLPIIKTVTISDDEESESCQPLRNIKTETNPGRNATKHDYEKNRPWQSHKVNLKTETNTTNVSKALQPKANIAVVKTETVGAYEKRRPWQPRSILEKDVNKGKSVPKPWQSQVKIETLSVDEEKRPWQPNKSMDNIKTETNTIQDVSTSMQTKADKASIKTEPCSNDEERLSLQANEETLKNSDLKKTGPEQPKVALPTIKPKPVSDKEDNELLQHHNTVEFTNPKDEDGLAIIKPEPVRDEEDNRLLEPLNTQTTADKNEIENGQPKESLLIIKTEPISDIEDKDLLQSSNSAGFIDTQVNADKKGAGTEETKKILTHIKSEPDGDDNEHLQSNPKELSDTRVPRIKSEPLEINSWETHTPLGFIETEINTESEDFGQKANAFLEPLTSQGGVGPEGKSQVEESQLDEISDFVKIEPDSDQEESSYDPYGYIETIALNSLVNGDPDPDVDKTSEDEEVEEDSDNKSEQLDNEASSEDTELPLMSFVLPKNEKIRCPCGSKKEDNDEIIKCEECNTWQHRECMDMREIETARDEDYMYLCSICMRSMEREEEVPPVESVPRRYKMAFNSTFVKGTLKELKELFLNSPNYPHRFRDQLKDK